eukprot:3709219-Rhodomonas_salina.11
MEITWRLSGRNAKLQSVVTANKSVSPKLSLKPHSQRQRPTSHRAAARPDLTRRFFTTGANAPSATICSSVFPPERESRHRIFMHCSCRWPSFVPATCATCTAALAQSNAWSVPRKRKKAALHQDRGIALRQYRGNAHRQYRKTAYRQYRERAQRVRKGR